MRKLKTQEDVNSKKRRNQIIVGVVLAAVLVFSIAGGAVEFGIFSSNGNGDANSATKITYNKQVFEKNSNNLWETTIEGQKIETFYSPLETENITIVFKTSLTDFYKKPLFFASNAGEGNYEILKNLYPFIERYQEACLSGDVNSETCKKNAVVKNCTASNMIIIKETNNTNVYKIDKCIFIEAPYSEQKRAADGVVFKIFGIQ